MAGKDNLPQTVGAFTPVLAELVEPAHLTFPRSGGVGVRLCGAWQSILPALAALGLGRGSSHGRLGSLEVDASFPEMQLSRTGCHALSLDGTLELRLPGIEEILCYEKRRHCLEVQFRSRGTPLLIWAWPEMPEVSSLRSLLVHASPALAGCSQCPRARRSEPKPPRQAGQLPTLDAARLSGLLEEARLSGHHLRLAFFSADYRHAVELPAGWTFQSGASDWQMESEAVRARLDRRVVAQGSLFFQEIPPCGWKVLCCAPGALGFATLQALPQPPVSRRIRSRSRPARFP